ncbi:hypothetical protein [cf. Phormidesmis sp. LEGE 11477]|uniref:hypothetical protein n=1 Tax=cf. Phormidesmis sp. LEGE 11477 TaxID=1828680 RepID=UPI00187ECCD8|nr:hypothetical protein [cf. Phormidesmis sp. LEGE 11477]MBE9064382.1 hypothetical protein [cf. Phormidesmis sp. LEGE 11477]
MTYEHTGREPMDEQRLADQLQKTGNLMDLTFDQAWLAEAAEDDGWIEAGVMMRPYVNYLKSLTPEQNRSLRFQAKLLGILLPELKQWITSWGLGQSFEPVYTAARQTLYRHLKQLTEEQEDWITALIDENDQRLPVEEQAVRSQTSSMLAQLFTVEDWHELAEVAAQGMSQTVLQIPQAVSDRVPATA